VAPGKMNMFKQHGNDCLRSLFFWDMALCHWLIGASGLICKGQNDPEQCGHFDPWKWDHHTGTESGTIYPEKWCHNPDTDLNYITAKA